jgi:hypothetical protein
MVRAFENDYAEWAEDQANAIKEHRFTDLDFEHLVEEVRDLGISEHRALKSSFIRLIQHLLKWKYQADYRLKNQSTYSSWYNSIGNQRADIIVLLATSPSLKPHIEEYMQWAYPHARREAVKDSKLPLSTFPETLEWSFDELMDYRLDP